MMSRVAKQTDQDSDRHDGRGSSTFMGDTKPEVKENDTNETLRDDHVHKSTSANNSNDANEKTSDRATVVAQQHKKVDLGPSDSDSKKSSHFFYFPLNHQFPYHYSHISFKANHHRRNISYYHRRYHYPHYLYPPNLYSNADHSMAPFDDSTLATSNISKKKERTGNRFLTVDTTHVKSDVKERNERYSRSYPHEHSAPRYNGFYHHQHHHPSSYPEDIDNRPRGHFDFFDRESAMEHEYPYSTTPIAINAPNTPQSSNTSSGFGSQHRNGASEEEAEANHKTIGNAHDGNHEAKWSRFYDQPPHHDHGNEMKKTFSRPHSAPTYPPYEDRRQASYSSNYYHNGWRAAYEHTEESYHPSEPYDRHYFSPSPPPPPPSLYPDYFVPSSEPFMSRAASPSMSWYEGSRGSYDEHDVPIRAPVPRYYSHPVGGYHYPHVAPPEQRESQRPGTPSSNQTVQRVPKVTPKKSSGRDSPIASNTDAPSEKPESFSSSNNAIVTPGEKSGASTFAPSSPFVSLRDSDIVCGRGAPTNYHVGNSRFRELVLDYNKDYFIAKRSDKPRIAMKVLDVLASRGARFVRRVKGGSSTSAHWEEVAHKIAYEKVCQALRDAGGPSRQMISSVASSALKRKSVDGNGGRNKRLKSVHSRTGGEEGKENCAVEQY